MPTTDLTRIPKRRDSLIERWLEDPHCFWCGRWTTLHHKPRLGHTATRDHIFSRKDDRRKKWYFGDGRTHWWLSCSICNEKRGHMKPERFAHKMGKVLPEGYEG